MSAASTAGEPLSILSWNIQTGSDGGITANGWPERKFALKDALGAVSVDIACVQEPVVSQLQFIDDCLPGFTRIGVGRDDGAQQGEFCAIYFLRDKFDLLRSGTFWLSDTPDEPKGTWDVGFKRICTWCILRHKSAERDFAIFSTHFPLNPFAHTKAAQLLIGRIGEYGANLPIVLAGDFNCTPDSAPWKLFAVSGLTNAEAQLKGSPQTPTHRKHSVVIDGIFLSDHWKVEQFAVLVEAVDGTCPSDHVGLLAAIRIKGA